MQGGKNYVGHIGPAALFIEALLWTKWHGGLHRPTDVQQRSACVLPYLGGWLQQRLCSSLTPPGSFPEDVLGVIKRVGQWLCACWSYVRACINHLGGVLPWL